MAGPALSSSEQAFIKGVVEQTGVDPRVLEAQIQNEGNPGDYQNNWLNIPDSTASTLGVTYRQGAYGTATYPTVQEGVAATVQEMKNLGLSGFGSMSPAQQIAKIQQSGWASSGYPSLPGLFAGDFGSGALTSKGEGGFIQSSGGVESEVTNTAGSLVNTGLGALTLIPGVNAGDVGLPNAQSAQGAVVDKASSLLSSPFAFFTSWRFAEVIGGVLLLLVGLVLLGRQFGISAPVPGAGKVPGGS